MTDDIVEQARELERLLRVQGMNHSADTVDALLDEVEIQQRVIDEAQLVVAKVTAERDALARDRDELRDSYTDLEMDRDYLAVLVDGSWDNADEIIAKKRAAMKGASDE